MLLRKLLLSCLLLAVACTQRERVFYAFTDAFVGTYQLDLFSNDEFILHVPEVTYSGAYTISGDTILLHHKRKAAKEAPLAYLIDSAGRKITELKKQGDSFVLGDYNNGWIQIAENLLKPR